jgi:hypothetical protein
VTPPPSMLNASAAAEPLRYFGTNIFCRAIIRHVYRRSAIITIGIPHESWS